MGQVGDEVSLPQIVLSPQSDASNQSNTPRNLSGISTPRNPPDVNSNLLTSSLQDPSQRPRSNSALSLVEQALAQEGLPQDNSLLTTVESELGDSLNFSKDQLEGAARDIILDFEREAGAKIEPAQPFMTNRNEASLDAPARPYDRDEKRDSEGRPDRTSYI